MADQDYPNDRSRHGYLVHSAAAQGRAVEVTAYLEGGHNPICARIMCRTPEQALEITRLLREATTQPSGQPRALPTADTLASALRETYAFCAKHVRTLVEHVPFDALVELARAEADASAAKARDDEPARREAAERCHRALGRVSEVAGKHLEIAEAVRELRVLLGV